jgi:hypothetical protein
VTLFWLGFLTCAVVEVVAAGILLVVYRDRLRECVRLPW